MPKPLIDLPNNAIPPRLQKALANAQQANMRATQAQKASEPKDAVEHLAQAVRLLAESNKILLEELTGQQDPQAPGPSNA
jgi:hypothetical protein